MCNIVMSLHASYFMSPPFNGSQAGCFPMDRPQVTMNGLHTFHCSCWKIGYVSVRCSCAVGRLQATVRARRDKAPGVIDLLLADAPGILKASQKQLREKSLKTRMGILVLLKELLAFLPDGQMQDVDQLLPGVISAMNVGNPTMRLAADSCACLPTNHNAASSSHQKEACFLCTLPVRFGRLCLDGRVLHQSEAIGAFMHSHSAVCRITAATARSYGYRRSSSWGWP